MQLKATKKHVLYLLEGETSTNSVNAITNVDHKTRIWIKTMEHINDKILD